MANTDRPNGFKPIGKDPRITEWTLTASQTIAKGDVVTLAGAGTITLATSTTAAVCGVAAEPSTSATAGTAILIYDDPNQRFEGQMGGSTGGALTNPVTCFTSGRFNKASRNSSAFLLILCTINKVQTLIWITSLL